MPFFVQLTLDDCVQGDNPTYEFDIGIDTARTPSKVWMTCKLNPTWPDGSAVFQVVGTIVSVIATSLVDNSRTWQTLFKLTSAQSANIPLTTTSGDVQVKLDNTDILTPVLYGIKSVVGYTATTA